MSSWRSPLSLSGSKNVANDKYMSKFLKKDVILNYYQTVLINVICGVLP